MNGIDGMPFPDGRVDAYVPPDSRPIIDANLDPTGPDGVNITAPMDGVVITTNRFTAACTAMPDAASMSPVAEVVFNVRDSGGGEVQVAAGSTGTATWEGLINVESLPNGAVTIQCVATDEAGVSAADEITVYIDHGPTIEVIRPANGDGVHGNINIQVRATPDPALPGDTMAGIADVKAFVSGVEIAVTDAGGGVYTGMVRADDPVRFMPPLEGPISFRAEATNQRGVTREARTIFDVDNTGPTVDFITPTPGQLVGGIITVRAMVSDPHGVDPDSVLAVFGTGSSAITSFSLRPTAAANIYEATYDSRELRQLAAALLGPSVQLVYPTLTVRARDLPGNEGAVGELVGMDYTPPIASLDPPVIREGQWETLTDQNVCSFIFDPVGEDAVDDETTLAQLSEFRARVEDRGNQATASSSVYVPFATVDETTVQLFVLDTTSQAMSPGDALIVDTDGDGACDDINPMLRPTSVLSMTTDALVVDFDPIGASGSSDFNPDGAGYVGWANCNAPTPLPIPFHPGPLCLTTDASRVIQDEVNTLNIIYGIPAFFDEACMGIPFDSVASNVQDGWACVAVRAVDRLGNVGVSPALRVCFDHDFSGDCVGAPTGFDCKGIYTRMPDGTEMTNQTGSCTTVDFPPFEVHQIGR